MVVVVEVVNSRSRRRSSKVAVIVIVERESFSFKNVGLILFLSIYMHIDYISIYEIYITPLQGNYSESLPVQARTKIKVGRAYMPLQIF